MAPALELDLTIVLEVTANSGGTINRTNQYGLDIRQFIEQIQTTIHERERHGLIVLLHLLHNTKLNCTNRSSVLYCVAAMKSETF